MPFTPYHIGPGLLIGLLLLKFLDLPTFLIASVIVDIEPFLVLLLNLNYPLHGFFHSFFGGTIIAVILAGFMSILRGYFTPIMTLFKLDQEISNKKILLSSLMGVYIHILLDAPIYSDIKPFFPLDYNPFYLYGALPGFLITLICVWCYLGAIVIYIAYLGLYVRNRKNPINKHN